MCDPDGLCGYANGDGPCTAANGGTVCRSGVCSIVRLCMAAGSCYADPDCASGSWCSVTTHTCRARLANGVALPVDRGHPDATLDGNCSPSAAAVVCASGVCDSDNACGYANGDGPCTAATAATVCRSGACSVDGTCVASGGCHVDADCSGATPRCNTASSLCAGVDAGPADTGLVDVVPADAGAAEASPSDASRADAPLADASASDTLPTDTGPGEASAQPEGSVAADASSDAAGATPRASCGCRAPSSRGGVPHGLLLLLSLLALRPARRR